MEVILIDDIYNLGRRGDVVDVAAGYGRNFLIPRKLALPATPGNLKMIEEQKVAMAKREAKDREQAEIQARELNQLHVLISRKAGETGVLFGSVTSSDVAELLEKSGISIDRRKVLLHHPIKSIGNYMVEIRPHTEVEAKILLSVLPEEEEAVARTMSRGRDSDKIYEELEAKVAEIEEATGQTPGPDEDSQESVNP